ncbi:V-type ATP synthase subunit D [Candidatus Aerophobetes bacterium]|uniref:V-type ATP synthase subunit D n=1 Tax=Aerophobetes bacterium TaxID=2030807 RepID=A0A2A4X6M9_UNCAE|nr:MAG: V-type ATP synthase subunit D [Candidatus Aerophobetes bacterium]
MATVKLTKNAMRDEQVKLSQLEKYLPTLQLKKAMLQIEVNTAALIFENLEYQTLSFKKELDQSAHLLHHEKAYQIIEATKVKKVETITENIAGAEIPIYQGTQFAVAQYSFFSTPVWFDVFVDKARELVAFVKQCKVAFDRKSLLEKELREVSIRVNLFEKVMIPRVKANIKKIKIFIGDQDLAAIAQAKAAKKKIMARKMKRIEDREAG